MANGTPAADSSETTAKVQGTTHLPNGANGAANGVGERKEEKVSGAELKKRAKAEKAARRAEEKQGNQSTATTETPGTKKTEMKAESGRKGVAAPAPTTTVAKAQLKRTGSTSTSQQKGLPLRQAQTQAPLPTEQPKKETKKVALFGHLYGQPRRTTIAAAGKDVHPAVLALGLQMSNYIICGSNARCLATLLVFKRVLLLFSP